MQMGLGTKKGWASLRSRLCKLGRALGLPVRRVPSAAERPTQLFRDQHRELLALATQVESCLVVFERSGHGAAVRECLSRLLGRLETHLIAEDCFMYPALMGHSHADLSQMAKTFAEEMGGLSQVFASLRLRWASVAAIEAAPNQFSQEMKGFLTALRERIEREDRELYALADQRSNLRFY